MIAQGQVIENFIEPSIELVDTWNGYWNAVMPIGHRSTMAYPFPRLQYDGFWHRIANSGCNAKTAYNISSMAKLRQYIGTCLGDALFVYLMDPVARERLRDVMVQMYFAPEIQPQVAGQSLANLAAFAYRKGKMPNIR